MYDSYIPKEIGKVIRILDKYTLLINAGIGILEVGNKIQVYELGDEIRNLDDSVIGYYVFIKDELNVVQVEDNYSVCKKEKNVPKYSESVFSFSPLLDDALTRKEPLSVDEADISPINQPNDLLIRVGDPVKLA